MFEFLSSESAERAINVANYTIRLLERRVSLPDEPGEAGMDVLGELTEAERPLATLTIGEIRQKEKMPLAALPQSAADKYLRELSRVVRESTDKTLSDSDLKRGRDILASWRERTHEDEPEHRLPGQVDGVVTEARKRKARSARPNRVGALKRHGKYLHRLHEMSDDELREEAKRLKESLFRLNFQLALGEADAVKTVRREKKSLARIMTIMRQRAVSERPS